jgi:hypothetical protein
MYSSALVVSARRTSSPSSRGAQRVACRPKCLLARLSRPRPFGQDAAPPPSDVPARPRLTFRTPWSSSEGQSNSSSLQDVCANVS